MRNTSPIDEFSNSMRSVIEEHAEFVTHLVVNRQRFENWLSLETYRRLYVDRAFSCELERQYLESGERCDFYLKADTIELWVEVKLCVTNYSKGFFPLHSPRPITNQISDIERDIQKLNRIKSANAAKAVFLIAYPLPIGHETFNLWNNHLQKFSCAMEQAFQIPLKKDGKTASLVVYRAMIAGS